MLQLFYVSLLVGNFMSSGNSLNCAPEIVDDQGIDGVNAASVLRDDGFISVVYHDLTNGDQTTKFLRCINEACTSKNITDLNLAPANNLGGTEVLYQSDGLPLLALQIRTGFTRRLYIIKCGDDVCDSSDPDYEITSVDYFGGDYVSGAVRADDTAVFTSYNSVFFRKLRIISCTNVACTLSTPVIVDSSSDSGKYADLKLNSLGNPTIAYNCPSGLCYVICGVADCNAGNNTIIAISGASSLGEYNSLVLDNDKPVITSYGIYNSEEGMFAVVCSDTTCSTPTINKVASIPEGKYNSVILNSNTGLPVIKFMGFAPTTFINEDGEEEEEDVPIAKAAECNDNLCQSANITTIDDDLYTGIFGDLAQSSSTDKFIFTYHNQGEGNQSMIVTVCES